MPSVETRVELIVSILFIDIYPGETGVLYGTELRQEDS